MAKHSYPYAIEAEVNTSQFAAEHDPRHKAGYNVEDLIGWHSLPVDRIA